MKLRILNLALAALLATSSSAAFALCTTSGSVRQCVDTVEEVHVDADGSIYVWITADDESAITGCTLTEPSTNGSTESSTVNGLVLLPNNPSFDKNHQALLLATASFLRVDINVVIPAAGQLGAGLCTISDVSLRP